MLSASQHLCTLPNQHRENKRNAEGRREKGDKPNNKSISREIVFECVCAPKCMCVHMSPCERAREGNRERKREMERDTKSNSEREMEGWRRETERQREKSNLQEHNKKLYLRQKGTHKGICLAVCSSRLL